MEMVTTIHHGLEVLSKLYNGKPSMMTFANRTQALNAAVKLGEEWEVYQWGRPFFVARKKSVEWSNVSPEIKFSIIELLTTQEANARRDGANEWADAAKAAINLLQKNG